MIIHSVHRVVKHIRTAHLCRVSVQHSAREGTDFTVIAWSRRRPWCMDRLFGLHLVHAYFVRVCR